MADFLPMNGPSAMLIRQCILGRPSSSMRSTRRAMVASVIQNSSDMFAKTDCQLHLVEQSQGAPTQKRCPNIRRIEGRQHCAFQSSGAVADEPRAARDLAPLAS